MLDHRLAKQKTKRLLKQMERQTQSGIDDPNTDPAIRLLLIEIMNIIADFRRDINEDYQHAVMTHAPRIAEILEKAGLSFEFDF